MAKTGTKANIPEFKFSHPDELTLSKIIPNAASRTPAHREAKIELGAGIGEG